MSEFNIALAGITAVILFLYGLDHFSKEIQRISGERFRQLLGKLTKIPAIGVVIGTLVTSVIQSSSATSVITMGLVNAGVINFKNSLGIIFGAMIGTTVTSQLVAFKLTNFAPYIITLGFLISIMRTRYSFVGRAIFYFGFVFFSLNLISQAMAPLQSDPRLLSFLSTPQSKLMSILFGAAFTAIVQSSSVTAGLAVIFSQSGLITLENAIPLIMGANIGTTVTAALAMTSMDLGAKRVALAHLIFNISGVIIFYPFINLLHDNFIDKNPANALANVHLIINATNAVIFTILVTPFSKFIEKLAPSQNGTELPTFEFPNLKSDFQFEVVENFTNKSFLSLFALLKENYNLVTLSIESNYRHIYDKVTKRIQFFDLIQKDFTKFFASVVNHVEDPEESKKVLQFINEYEYLYQVHDSIKDILEIKSYMDEMYIEMHTDMLLHYREISSRTLHVFALINLKILNQNGDDNIIMDEFTELKKVLNEFSKALFKLMQQTERNDTGTNMHFMTYSQRLKDKLQNLFELIK
jgi:phosphate:Na+ symporter